MYDTPGFTHKPERSIDLSPVVATLLPVNQSFDVEKAIRDLSRQVPTERDDYTTGVADGLNWAIRYLLGDKSAS